MIPADILVWLIKKRESSSCRCGQELMIVVNNFCTALLDPARLLISQSFLLSRIKVEILSAVLGEEDFKIVRS